MLKIQRVQNLPLVQSLLLLRRVQTCPLLQSLLLPKNTFWLACLGFRVFRTLPRFTMKSLNPPTHLIQLRVFSLQASVSATRNKALCFVLKYRFVPVSLLRAFSLTGTLGVVSNSKHTPLRRTKQPLHRRPIRCSLCPPLYWWRRPRLYRLQLYQLRRKIWAISNHCACVMPKSVAFCGKPYWGYGGCSPHGYGAFLLRCVCTVHAASCPSLRPGLGARGAGFTLSLLVPRRPDKHGF